ncbi:MAG TPA: Rho termination factor N-terminal domain-containing protein [Leifsonia sp.]
MAKQKKLEKAAKNALERAKAAIADARKLTAKLDAKNRKKKKHALDEELAQVERQVEESEKRVDGTTTVSGSESASASGSEPAPETPAPAVAAEDLTPPLPSVVEDENADQTEFVGGGATTPHDPELDRMTVQALRDVAKARGLSNISRLNKAQLIERLSE